MIIKDIKQSRFFMKGEYYVRLMSAFVSHKPELSENGTGAQWNSQPGPQMTQRLNTAQPQWPHVAQVAGLLKKEGRFPTPSAIAPPTATATRMVVAALKKDEHPHHVCHYTVTII